MIQTISYEEIPMINAFDRDHPSVSNELVSLEKPKLIFSGCLQYSKRDLYVG